MSWYAVDAVPDAIEATREFLFPFDLGRWARLAVIVFFISGGGGGGGANSGSQFTSNAGTGGGGMPPIGAINIPWWVWVLLVAILVLALAFALVSSVMRYVIVDALRTDEVRIVEPFTGRLRQGLTLFGFNVALFVLVLGPIALLFGVFWLLGMPLVGVVVGLPLVVVLAMVLSVVGSLTIDFVVPVSIAEDVGIIGGWREFWPTLRAEWKQVGVYLVVKLVLSAVIGIVAGLAMAVVAIPLGVLGLVAGLIGFGGGGALGLLGIAVLALVIVPIVLVFVLVVLVVQIPVVTYLTFFALLALGDLERDWDLIPERRAEIRTA